MQCYTREYNVMQKNAVLYKKMQYYVGECRDIDRIRSYIRKYMSEYWSLYDIKGCTEICRVIQENTVLHIRDKYSYISWCQYCWRCDF